MSYVIDEEQCERLFQRLASGEDARTLIVAAYRLGIEDLRKEVLAKIEKSSDVLLAKLADQSNHMPQGDHRWMKNNFVYLVMLIAALLLFCQYLFMQ